MRKKIAVFIDFSLRIPSFHAAYAALKEYMFSVESEDELEGEFQLRDFWKDAGKQPEIEKFYKESIAPEDDSENREWRKFFYSEEHYFKFLEDYSFNLFVDAAVPCKQDIELLNIAQKYLFEVVLVDEYITTRKKTNTFFFLSKTRVTPQSVLFLKEGETLSSEEYLGIWNPKVNQQQLNKEGSGEFEIWLKELEAQVNNEHSH